MISHQWAITVFVREAAQRLGISRKSFALAVTAVSAMMLSALAQSQERVGKPQYLSALQMAAAAIDSNMATFNIPGTVLMAVDRDGIVFEAGYGYANVEAGTLADPGSTLFRIASMSKPFTALAALGEVENGRLTLDRNVGEMLPEGMLDNRTGTDLTLHHLLTHTSGLERRNYGSRARSPGEREPLGEHLARVLPPVVRKPGEALVYSNYGFTLIGYLIERSSGESFNTFVTRTIFEPLGMSHSSFDVRADTPGLATGYVEGRAIDTKPAHTIPAGQMTTTAADMARFMIAVLNDGYWDGRQVLSRSALHKMMQPQFRNAPGLPIAYGYGMWIYDRPNGSLDSAYHRGDMRGWSAMVEFFPTAGLGVFMASNSSDGEEVHSMFMRELLAQLSSTPETEADESGPFERLSDHNTYVGEYLYGGVSEIKFDRFASLMMGAMPVEIGPDGVLLIDRDPYAEVEPGLFRRTSDAHPRLAMVQDPLTGYMTVRTSWRTYFEVKDSIPVGIQRLGLVLSLALMAVSILIWGTQALRWPSRKHGRSQDRWLKSWATLCGLCYVVFMIGFAISAAMGIDMETGVPWMIVLLLGLASLGAVAAVTMPLVLVRALLIPGISIVVKLHYVLFTVAALVATAVYWHWNVIGMKI